MSGYDGNIPNYLVLSLHLAYPKFIVVLAATLVSTTPPPILGMHIVTEIIPF